MQSWAAAPAKPPLSTTLAEIRMLWKRSAGAPIIKQPKIVYAACAVLSRTSAQITLLKRPRLRAKSRFAAVVGWKSRRFICQLMPTLKSTVLSAALLAAVAIAASADPPSRADTTAASTVANGASGSQAQGRGLAALTPSTATPAPSIVTLPETFLLSALSLRQAAVAEPDAVQAVEPGGPGGLTKCRDWVVTESCKTYHHIRLPSRIEVGDTLTLNFGTAPSSTLSRSLGSPRRAAIARYSAKPQEIGTKWTRSMSRHATE
jgi:hypothetical protein